MRTKVYSKIVSNFEAGEVCEQFGGHLAEYVDCTNQRLRKTFLHPDVQARGCTRIEISLYACTYRTPETADNLVDYALDLVSPEDTPLFVEQSASRHWENFAKQLDRCFVLADRPNSTIYVCWYAHTRTGRLAGVRISPTKQTVDCDKRWNRAIQWAMGDFGFRNCPIFHTEILGLEKSIQMTNLQCYTKDSKTILCASRRPTQLHPNAEDPSKLLPPVPTVEWEWRKKKCHAIGVDLPTYSLQEVPEIAAKRNISLLSTRQRADKFVYLLEEQSAEEWKRRTWENLEKYQKEYTQNIEQRKQELVDIHKYIEQNRIDLYRSQMVYSIVVDILGWEKTTNISTLAGKGVWSVLGYRFPKDKKYCRVVVAEKEGGVPTSIWANNGLRKVLQATTDSVEKEVDTYKRETYWFPREYYKRFPTFVLPELHEGCVPPELWTTNGSNWQNNEEGTRIGLDIRVQPQKKFVPAGQKKEIAWYPIDIVQAPDPAELPSLRQLALEKEQEEKQAETLETMYETEAPNKKDWKKTIDLAPGQYLCRRYADTLFRGNTKTIRFLLPTDENGEPTTDAEIPTHGHFLEKEVERIGDLQKVLQPIVCKVGIEKTTPQKKKDRLFYIVAQAAEQNNSAVQQVEDSVVEKPNPWEIF